jgi:hypothetical protein
MSTQTQSTTASKYPLHQSKNELPAPVTRLFFTDRWPQSKNELPAATEGVAVGAAGGARSKRTLFFLVLPPLPFVPGTGPSPAGAMDGRGRGAAW